MIDINYRNADHIYPIELSGYIAKSGKIRLDIVNCDETQESFFIEVYKNDVLSIKNAKDCEQDFFDANFRNLNEECKTTESENHVSFSFGEYCLNVQKKPFGIDVKKDGIEVLAYQFSDLNPVGDGLDIIAPLGKTKIGEKVLCSDINLKLRQDERIFGLGERFTSLSKVGEKVVMNNFDTLGCRDQTAYKNIPFYLSTYGYGLFVNSTFKTEFNVGNESICSLSIHIPTNKVEHLIFLSDDPKKIVSNYSKGTGEAKLPPKWSFGLWYSTSFKSCSEQDVIEDLETFKQKNIPCDVFHFDTFWLNENKWCDFVWNDNLFPNPKELIANIKNRGMKVCVWVNPYVTNQTQMFEIGKEKGYFVKNKFGETYLCDLWHGLTSPCAIVDFTNDEAKRWYIEKIQSLYDIGVDVIKTDFGEDIPVDGVFANGQSGEAMHNLYTDLYNNAVFEQSIKNFGDEALVWGRCGTIGMQKYPVCWGGDPRSCYESMAGTLRGGLSLGVSGVPFWSHDIGGFYGKVSPEVFVRWSQFGLFTSHSRLHGTTSRKPWDFGEKEEAIFKKFVEIRYNLMDYIYKTAQQCAANGLPMLRQMYLENPDDKIAMEISDQYYFGDKFIVAPVFGGDMAIRSVYLPKGQWKDFLTNEEFSGGKYIRLTCPLEYMPIFEKI